MDFYTFATALGGAGLAGMAALGVGHLGGHGAAGHDAGSHAGAPHAGGPHVDGGHDAHPHLPTAIRTGTRGGLRPTLLSLASPRVLFSVLLGVGITGLLLRPVLPSVLLALAAVAGGIALEAAIVRPVWNLLFRFASTPAASLEGSVYNEATATSGFDANGEGLVSLEVDGQLVQCLAMLRESDRQLGIRVRSGDLLRVEEVDPARSRCTVSYVQHGSATR